MQGCTADVSISIHKGGGGKENIAKCESIHSEGLCVANHIRELTRSVISWPEGICKQKDLSQALWLSVKLQKCLIR